MQEFLDFEFEIKDVHDEEKGIIEGHGSIFGLKDFHNEIVDKGAFKKSLRKRNPAMLLQHDGRDVLGLWTVAKEDETGLFLRGQLNMNVQKSRDTFFLAKQGALTGLSIGFFTVTDKLVDNVRHITEVNLLEVSLVTFPANELAKVSGVKSDFPSTEREFEKALREKMGYGREQSKVITSKGFKGFQAMQRDADSLDLEQRDADKILNQLNSLTQSLKEFTNATGKRR